MLNLFKPFIEQQLYFLYYQIVSIVAGKLVRNTFILGCDLLTSRQLSMNTVWQEELMKPLRTEQLSSTEEMIRHNNCAKFVAHAIIELLDTIRRIN